MRIAELLGRSRPTISFEFMAPRDETEVEVLEKTIAALAGHAPDWVSVTYRLRTGDKTLELVTRIKRQYHIEAMAHLTCANSADQTRPLPNWMGGGGAVCVGTQVCFDSRFCVGRVGGARGAGVKVPIVPGLMPGPSRRSLAHMTAMSGATVPSALQRRIDEQPGDDAVRRFGVEHCIAQCAELLEAGVPGLHFYTFNRARAPIEILAALRGQQLIAS